MSKKNYPQRLTTDNLLLLTDVYKMYHMLGGKPGTTKVYSYLCARSDKKYNEMLWFGFQAIVKRLTQGISKADVKEFLETYEEILGGPAPKAIVKKIKALQKLGYIPLEIKAVPEGTVVGTKNVLATITNTHPDFPWVVGFFESYLLKVWAPTTVATYSRKFRNLFEKYAEETSDSGFLTPFQVHDFGYRGVSSEETAAILGAAHLVNSCGSDTVPAIPFIKNAYGFTRTPGDFSLKGLLAGSVPATEHSLHCSFGPTEENELEYVLHQLKMNPTGILSVVSDAYDYWRMLTVTLPKVKAKILARQGKYVVRPDSGDPKKILCGDPSAPFGSAQFKGTFRIMDEIFGSTVNSKGYKELNANVGVIYGDGMFFARAEDILETMKEMGYASTNLVIGVGGLLLQQHNRDDGGFAFKATSAIIDGISVELFKDPITDSGKRSHKGYMKLTQDEDGKYVTIDQVSEEEAEGGLLETVFNNGLLTNQYTFNQVRERASSKIAQLTDEKTA